MTLRAPRGTKVPAKPNGLQVSSVFERPVGTVVSDAPAGWFAAEQVVGPPLFAAYADVSNQGAVPFWPAKPFTV